MSNTKNKKIKNRAFTKDRPIKAHQCKNSDITNKTHTCHPDNGGHNFQFYRMDRYGICKKCGDETLS